VVESHEYAVGDAAVTDRAAAALALSMWPTFARAASGGWARVESGVSAYCTGSPVPIFNGVIAPRGSDPAVVARLLDAVAHDAGDAFCLQTRPGAHEAEQVARARGLVRTEQEPLMLLEDPGRLAAAAAVEGVDIVRLRTDQVDRHLRAMVDGFGATLEAYAPWLGSTLLTPDDVFAYVGSVDGHDIATGLGIVAHGFVGVHNVAVNPGNRRRGYGAALTARIVLDGIADGAHRALLMASELGLPVYQRLGFHALETWSSWTPDT